MIVLINAMWSERISLKNSSSSSARHETHHCLRTHVPPSSLPLLLDARCPACQPRVTLRPLITGTVCVSPCDRELSCRFRSEWLFSSLISKRKEMACPDDTHPHPESSTRWQSRGCVPASCLLPMLLGARCSSRISGSCSVLVRHSILPEGSADACSLYDDGREVRKRRPLHTRPPSKVLGCRVVGRATAGKDDAMNNKLKGQRAIVPQPREGE